MPTAPGVIAAREQFDQATAAMTASATAPPPATTAETTETIDTTESPPVVAVEEGDATTVDQTADTTAATASDESETVDPADEIAQEAPQKGSRAQERIKGLVAERNALKIQLEYLQNDVLSKLQTTTTTSPASHTPPADSAVEEAAPSLESVGYDTDKWTKAMQAWTDKKIQAGVKTAVQTVQQTQSADAVRAAFETRLAAFEAKAPDFKVVLGNPALPQLHRDTAAYVVGSDLGPQILYHLGKHPDIAVRIARQAPAAQAAAIGRIEAQLTPAAKPKVQSNVTKAPPPPSSTASAGTSGASRDITKMPIAEAMRLEREVLIQRRTKVRA